MRGSPSGQKPVSVLFQVKSQMQNAFQKDWDNVVTVEPLLYGDFLDLKNPCYQELSDLAELEERVSASLYEFNSAAQRPLDLVLFPVTLQHTWSAAEGTRVHLIYFCS